MSDKADNISPSGAATKFSDREVQLLGWAMQSLKSGPPDIDYENLAKLAGVSNPRSASNAWSKLRNKLTAPSDGTAPPTPKKATPRKKTVKGDAENGTTPKKTPAKRQAKKQEVDGAGEGSPKKRGRPAKAKPEAEENPEDTTSSDDNDIKNEEGEDEEV